MRVNDLAAERSEELRFDEVVVFYSQVFDLGSNVNPTEAARALLREDFALVAPNYITNEVEVADRFKDLKRLRSSAETLSDLVRSLDTGGLRGAARWALHHPTRSLRLLPLFLRRKKARNPPRQGPEGDAQARGTSHTESAAEGSEPAEERAMRFMDDAMRNHGRRDA